MSAIDIKKKDPKVDKVKEREEKGIKQPSHKDKRYFSKIRSAIKRK